MRRISRWLAISCGVFLTTSATVFAQNQELEPHVIRDPAAVHKEAVTFLKPRGWRVTGGIQWYPNHTHQACLEVKVSNPEGLEQIETFPYSYLTWVTNPVFPLQPGSNYLGSIVMPPIEDPREVVRKITIPTLRPSARITGYQEMPEVAKALAPLHGGARIRSGKIRLEYALNGQEVEEDVYLSVFTVSANLGTGATSTIWGPAWIPYSLRAARGKLDEQTPLLLAVANSGRFDPRWFSEYLYVCDLFQQRQAKGIQNAVNLSQTISQNSDAIFRMYSDSYWKRQASQDRIARNFSNYIRGVQNYQVPGQKYHVQLPNTHRYAWTSSSGSYLLSNDANFDPNAGSNQTWTLLKQAE